MANCTDATTTAIDDMMSHQSGAAAHTGDSHHHQDKRNQADTAADMSSSATQVKDNLLYTEDLGFFPMRKDPRYTFYRHPKHEKFDFNNEDVLHVIEEADLLVHLELLQVSRSNKSIEVRFNTERAAQHFVGCDFSLNGDRFAFRSNAQRRLRVSIHGVHPNISDASLECELSQYFGGILDIRRDTKQYKNKVYQTGTRTFIITELYRHIPRSCRLFNRWCLVYYTGQPYSARKKTTEPEKLDKDDASRCPLPTLGKIRRTITLMRNPLRVLKQWRKRTSASHQKEI